MAGRKRAAGTDPEKRETRSSKVAKTEGTKSAGRAAKGAARLKTSMAQSTFMSRAVPLHVSITATPPTATPPTGESQEPGTADPGFLTSTSLVPSTFATGSFGWKGHKRMVVVLPKAEGEDEGEKVHVTLTINATVIGSKDVKEGEEHEGEKEEAGEHAAEETSGEVAESQPEQSPGAETKESEGNKSPAGEEQAEESAS